MTVIDAHAHLVDGRFADDLDEVLARAAAAGVERILSCGEDVPSSAATIALAARHAAVRAAVGVHPHHAASWSDAAARTLRALARDARVVAIGEIGVDLSGRSGPRAAQERAFVAQLELARALDLPAVIHVRDAGPLARALVDRVPGVRGMVHCFSEGPADAAEWVRRGLYVSFAGTVTYAKNEALRAAAGVVPLDRILVETDAPYLAPLTRRGRRNEPAFAVESAAALATARGMAPDALGAAVSANARRLFGPRWDQGNRAAGSGVVPADSTESR